MIGESKPLNPDHVTYRKNSDLENNGSYATVKTVADCQNNVHIRVFVFIFIVFATAGCFLVIYFRSNDLCGSRSYRKTSIHNVEYVIGQDTDPCTDFYSFACGRWNDSNSKKYNVVSVVEETEVRNLHRLDCLLKYSAFDDANSWSQFMKDTYDLCQRERSSLVAGSETVAFVQKMAAPLLLSHGNRSSLQRTLRDVHHNLLQNGLFSWDVTLDLKDNEIIQALRISPPKKAWNAQSLSASRQALTEYIQEVLVLLGADEESIRSKSDEIAEYVTLTHLHSNGTSQSRLALLYRNRVPYREFIKTIRPPGNFQIDFGDYFRDFSLPDSIYVIVEGEEYFRWLENVGKEKKSAMIDYLYWSLIDFFVPYMPKVFGDARERYARKTGSKFEGRHACANAVKKGMNFAVSSFFMDKVLDDKSRDMVNEIILHVKNSFRDFLHSLQRPVGGDHKWLGGLEKVFNNIEIGVPTHLRRIYEDPLPFEPVEKSFTSHYLAAVGFVKARMIGLIKKPPLAVLFLPDFLELNGLFLSLPLLVIHMGILTPPLFDPLEPLCFNYAGLGFVLSHELAHSIYYLGAGVPSVMNTLESKLQCLQKQYAETKRLPEVIEEDFADNVGINIAYKAYLEQASRHYPTGKTTLKERKMFFLHFAQILCEDGSSFSMDSNAFHSPYKHRVNIPLSNSPSFSETFSCHKGTRMNNENRCLI